MIMKAAKTSQIIVEKKRKTKNKSSHLYYSKLIRTLDNKATKEELIGEAWEEELEGSWVSWKQFYLNSYAKLSEFTDF